MKSIFIILLIAFASRSYSQKATFKEFIPETNSSRFKDEGLSIVFPIVVTKDPKIDKLINDRILEDVLRPDSSNKNLKELLEENISEYGLVNTSFTITYNNNNFLSFNIYIEGCGAYCFSTNIYFNFDLTTGKKITINDIILENKRDSFKNTVFTDKINSLNKYKLEEQSFIGTNDIDSSDYKYIIEHIDEYCINQISLEEFSVSLSAIEFFDRCTLPHVIQSQEPIIELKYPFTLIGNSIDPKFKFLLD